MKVLSAAAALLLGTTQVALAYYEGSWSYDSHVYETMELGDNSDGSVRFLEGTAYYCGRPGASYSTMHQVLRNTGGADITWWVADDCGTFVRICVQNWRGQKACSTYIDNGWYY